MPVKLDLARRGTFLFQAEVDGWESRETTFCRIPDLAAITRGKPTRLGFTVHAAPQLGYRTEKMLQIARRLGLTTCRAVHRMEIDRTRAGALCPRALGPILRRRASQRRLDRHHHLRSAGLGDASRPARRLPDVRLRPGCLPEMVTTVSKRYKGKFWGWEWLNEITPGGTPDYVADYVKLCRAGVESARAVDPGLHSVLAGGLVAARLSARRAQRRRRQIHGRPADPLRQRRRRRRRPARTSIRIGHGGVGVWENESCAFVIQWDCPGLEWSRSRASRKWVITQWTDELAAGCEKLIYFGGEGDAIGNGDYMLGRLHAPADRRHAGRLRREDVRRQARRRVLTPARPARFHLFERDGKPMLVAASDARKASRDAVGRRRGVGSRHGLSGKRNRAARPPTAWHVCRLADMPVFHRGGGPGRAQDVSGAVDRRPSDGPSRDASVSDAAAQLLQRQARAPFRFGSRTCTTGRLAGTLRVDLPAGWSASDRKSSFELEPGEAKIVSIPVTRARGRRRLQSFPHRLTVTFDRRKASGRHQAVRRLRDLAGKRRQSAQERRFRTGRAQTARRPNTGTASTPRLVSSDGLGLGPGQARAEVCRLQGLGHTTARSSNLARRHDLPVYRLGLEPGHGRRLEHHPNDEGRRAAKPLYDNQVINIGDSTPSWQVFTCRLPGAEGLGQGAFRSGGRRGRHGLVRQSSRHGLRGQRFRRRSDQGPTSRPAIDGKLDDWDGACPIPLIGRNQLSHRSIRDYAWTPQNLSGVAYLRWDAKNLYVAVEVLDDVHHPAGDGETVIDGDSVILAFDPTNRSPDAASQVVRLLRFVAEAGRRQRRAHALAAQLSTAAADARASWLAIRRFTRSIVKTEPTADASTSCASRGASWGSRPLSAESSASPSN